MKKILGLLVGIVFIFGFPKSTFAQCNPRGNTPNCVQGQIQCCSLSNNSPWCCDQAGGGCSQTPGLAQGICQTYTCTQTAGQYCVDRGDGCSNGSVSGTCPINNVCCKQAPTSTGCKGPNAKTGICYGQITCTGTSSPLCCDTQEECIAAATNPIYINCTANTATQCLASQPIGCNKNGTYCCAVNNDCTLLGGTVDSTRSFVSTSGSSTSVYCTDGSMGINTAIGCIHFDSTEGFVGDILKWAVGIGGGIAFLLIVYGGFMVMTSAGNPERLKAGQELLTSAISGLILLVFSIFILKFIGIDILGLNTFGFGN